MAVRVNVHPRPSRKDWDLHLPYVGNSYDQKYHVQQSYLSEFKSKISTDQSVVLINNGEPVSRQLAVKKILENDYPDVIIDQQDSCYKPTDAIFKESAWSVIPNTLNGLDQQLIEYYLKHYLDLTLFSNRYQYQFHDRDHGYFKAVKRFWYHAGKEMPAAPDKYHETMYTMFDNIFQLLIGYLKELPLSLTKDQLADNLMLRLNHNPPGSGNNRELVPRHVDNSIVTLWLHQSHPGAYVDFGQENITNQTKIVDLYDQQKEIFMFPGVDYCDHTKTMIPATWHGVINDDDCHRVSLVAFLKY